MVAHIYEPLCIIQIMQSVCHCASIRKIGRYMFCEEMIVVCCENYVEYVGAIYGQNTEILVLRLVVHILTTML